MMKKFFGLWISICLLSGCSSSSITKNEQLKIVVASDLHYFLKDYYQDCEWFEESILYGDGKMVTYGDEIIDAFIERIIELKPDLVVLTGDLSFNGEVGSHQGLAKKLLTLKNEGITVAVLPGNHDVDNIFAKGYGKDDYFQVASVNAKEFKEIYKDLGYSQAMTQHKESLSYHISLNDDYDFIMLDSTAHELTGSSLDVGGYLTESTMFWLKDELEKIHQQGKIPLVALHHNLAVHNDLLNQGYTIKDNEKIAKLLQEYQVPFVLTGHIHCQNIKEIQGIYDIASSSLLDAPLQYGVIDLNNEKMTYHCESLQISADANTYFDIVTRHKMGESFSESQEDQSKLETLVLMNRYYFAGTMALHKEEFMNMEGYQLLLKDEGFYKDYVYSMMSEDMDGTQLEIDFHK